MPTQLMLSTTFEKIDEIVFGAVPTGSGAANLSAVRLVDATRGVKVHVAHRSEKGAARLEQWSQS